MENDKEKQCPEEENDPWSEFKPMEEVFNSGVNSYELGPGGDLDPTITNTGKRVARSCKLYVKNFNKALTLNGLKNIFGVYGTVVSVTNLNSNLGPYCFIVMKQIDEAMRAIHALHNKAPHNMFVEFAKPKERKKHSQRDDGWVPGGEWPEVVMDIKEPPIRERRLEDRSGSVLRLFNNEAIEKLCTSSQCTSIQLYNRVLTEITQPRTGNEDHAALQAKIAKISVEERFKPLKYNIETYNKCSMCENPAMYKNATGIYCSQDCQRQESLNGAITYDLN